jgi:ribosomal-protein-alanine N-acetyltransferase
MELIPIKQTLEENSEFMGNPLCQESLVMCIEFYKKVGFTPPWICYYVKQDEELIASAAFKGKAVNDTVEIAYATFEKFQRQGIGTAVCKQLVELSLKTNPSVRITARTLPENNFSTRILEKNNFTCLGMVQDPEDGAVWEWEYKGNI